MADSVCKRLTPSKFEYDYPATSRKICSCWVTTFLKTTWLTGLNISPQDLQKFTAIPLKTPGFAPVANYPFPLLCHENNLAMINCLYIYKTRDYTSWNFHMPDHLPCNFKILETTIQKFHRTYISYFGLLIDTQDIFTFPRYLILF